MYFEWFAYFKCTSCTIEQCGAQFISNNRYFIYLRKRQQTHQPLVIFGMRLLMLDDDDMGRFAMTHHVKATETNSAGRCLIDDN